MRAVLLAALVFSVTGCDRRQPWTFQNGTGLDDTHPPILVAEVFTGDECGFACQPPGQRRYCEELTSSAPRGPSPDLPQGDRFCFMGTALDEEARAFAMGCVVASAGVQPIEVTLSAIEEGRVIRRRCPDEGGLFDAGSPADAGARDSGAVLDGEPVDRDAGPAVDVGSPVRVRVVVGGPGRVTLFDDQDEMLTPPVAEATVTIDSYVGFYLRIEASPGPGAILERVGVPHCGDSSPCELILARSEDIDVRFAASP